MPDFTMCGDTSCPHRLNCHRAQADPSPRQSYFAETPRTGEECQYYLPTKGDEMEEFTKSLRPCGDFPDGAWYLSEGPGQDETPEYSDPSGEILLVSDPDEGQYLVVQRFHPRAEIDNPDDNIVHADDLLEFDGYNNVLIGYGPVTNPQQCRDLVSGLVRFHNNLMLRWVRR